jgi:hypothetical protein
MIDSLTKRFLAVVVLATAAGFYGCASSDPAQTAMNTCQGADQQDCEARDNARQIRDEVDYQQEPSLGYLSSPQGLLPIPVTVRNTSN